MVKDIEKKNAKSSVKPEEAASPKQHPKHTPKKKDGRHSGKQSTGVKSPSGPKKSVGSKGHVASFGSAASEPSPTRASPATPARPHEGISEPENHPEDVDKGKPTSDIVSDVKSVDKSTRRSRFLPMDVSRDSPPHEEFSEMIRSMKESARATEKTIQPEKTTHPQKKKTVHSVEEKHQTANTKISPAYVTSRVSRFFALRGITSVERDYTEYPRRGRIIAICALLLALCLIGIAVLTYVLLLVHSDDSTLVCTTKECLQVSADMAGLLNEAIHPCDDFYDHVCHHWITTAGSSFLDDAIGAFYNTLDSILRSADLARIRKNGMHVFVDLYSSCKKFMLNNATGSFKDDVKSAGSALNISALVNAPNFPTLFQQLLRIAFDTGIHSIFSMSFQRKDKKSVLHLSIGRTIAGKIRDLFIETRQPYSGTADSYIDDVVGALASKKSVEKMAQGVISYDAKWDNSSKDMTSKYLSFKELASILGDYPVEEFLKLINNAAPPYLRQNQDSYVYLTGNAAIDRVRYDMYYMDAPLRAMYSSVNVLTDVLQYAFLRNFVAEIRKATVICIKVAQSSLIYAGPYLASLLSGYTDSPSRIRKMTRQVKDGLLDTPSLQWMGSVAIIDIKSLLDNTAYLMYEDDYFSSLTSGIDYTTFSVKDSDFMSACVKVKTFEMQVALRNLPTEQTALLSKRQFVPYVSSTPSLNLIIIPTILQGPPIFYFDQSLGIPIYFNYGTLGVQIGKRLVELVRRTRNWASESQRKYAALGSCIGEMRTFLNLSRDESGSPHIWIENAFDLSYGARMTFEALRALVNQGRVSTAKAKVALKTFFIRSCMFFCGSPFTDSHLTAKERCLMATITNPAFSEIFQCTGRAAAAVPSCVPTMFAEKDRI
ncbi:uncharacterized protein LOC135400018 [Ornithodoros turicata]|uniref:uncharacterized protein LOC135400018 n=1 Tax=Ornithodoros turicata TaxID=34597 RepID=UPI00313906F8